MRADMNAKLTQTNPGTPMGQLLRQYWQPVALSEELAGSRPVRPVTLLGERLVLFINDGGQLGLMDRHCAHRGADLCYGRLEDGGLRCPFHGWLYDHQGQCQQTPGEPASSQLHQSIRLQSYPCIESNGMIFAWLGHGDPPPLPDLDCFTAPVSHSFAFKGLMECNWLQALEVGIDPAHASYLHRYLVDDDPADSYGQQFRDAVHGGTVPTTHILREFTRPDISVESTDYGLRLITRRHLNDEFVHVRVTHQVFPHAIVIPMSREMIITQWHVPVTDTQCYWYAMFTSYDSPCDHARMREQRLALYELPNYKPRIGQHNHYGYDPQEQSTRTYTGMGDDINVHDQWAVESPGAIQDRTKEHLGSTDVAIIENRRRLNKVLRASDNATTPDQRSALFQPARNWSAAIDMVAIDTVAPSATWHAHWQSLGKQRRREAPWNVTTQQRMEPTHEAASYPAAQGD